ncbi:MAG TPA: bacterial transcriptional activator domain-containing protein [Anaerolineae bacterium]|nr:bacterial transcriptional activator domain-containing protein [Anaerolineae bacterium]
MPTKQTRRDVVTSSATVMAESQAHDLWSRGLNYLQQDDQLAIEFFERTVQVAHHDGQSDLACRAAACLGVMEMEANHPQKALAWFDNAMTAARDAAPSLLTGQLQLLSRLTRALGVARETERQLHEAQRAVQQEIAGLKLDAQETAGQLLHLLVTTVVARPAKSLAPQPAAPPADESVIFVRLLGRCEAQRADGKSFNLCSNRKGQALFRILVSQPKAHYHKEKLMALFWPDDQLAVAAGKLHVAASRLRRALFGAGLGNDALLYEDDCYFLNSRLQIQSDVVLFEEHFRLAQRFEGQHELDRATAEYEAALALYRGPYLAEVIDEDWLLANRAQLEEQFLIVLARLAERYFTQSRYGDCTECCRQALSCDSLREDIYRQLMRCLAQSGQRNQALRVYQTCVRVLQEELGIQPMHETTELAERIRQGQTV